MNEFRNPDLGRLQLAWAGVSLSMWAFAITLGVYAFDAGGAAAVGVAGLARLLPGVLAAPFGGLLGDRFSHRAVLVASSLTNAVSLVVSALAVIAGFRVLLTDPPIRLLGASLALIMFFLGAADVLVVVIALDLLGLSNASVGYLNAAWGIGGLAAGAGLAVLINRGHLVAGLVLGSLLLGAAMALPGIWTVAVSAYVGWFLIGVGFTFVEVAGNTLLQRLSDDEEMARIRGALETAHLGAMALGTFLITVLVSLAGVRVATLALAALLPLFVLLRWTRLREYEVGAPVAEGHFALLRENNIFAPLSLATLERITNDLTDVEASPGQAVITQGEIGDRFYLIESGRVEVFEDEVHRRFQGPGESFGEIALLRGSPRTATVRATETTRLLAVDRDHFITAITGHARTNQVAEKVADSRLNGPGDDSPDSAQPFAL